MSKQTVNLLASTPIRKSRFFWKLLLSYFLIVLALSLSLGTLVHYQLKNTLLEDIHLSLSDKLSFLQQLTEPALSGQVSQNKIQNILQLIGAESRTRITLILPDGRVLADSHSDPKRMDNHKNRPEILEAKKHHLGTSQRFSRTTEHSMMYVAKNILNGENSVGVVRVSIPLSHVEARLKDLRLTIFLGASFGILIAVLAGVFVALKITVPIQEMTHVAQALHAGEYDQKVRHLPHDEVGILGKTFNQLGNELNRKIESLYQEKTQLNTMLTSMVEGVIAIDLDAKVLFCNEAAKSMLQVDELGAPEKRLWDFPPLWPLKKIVQHVHTHKSSVTQEVQLSELRNGLVCNVVVSPLERGDDSQGFLLVFHNISDLKRLETIRSDFVANVSHELKTPLTSIKGYVETLLSGALHDEKNNVRFLEKINSHVNQLTNLVQDLLNLAKIEAEQEGLPTEKVDWNSVVQEVISHHDLAISKKPLSLTVELSQEPISIKGDRKGMLQIAGNLLANASAYTPANGMITIKTYREPHWGCFEIKDTGIGIAQHELARIFERFYRIDKARSREMAGTGLGLAIVKHLVSAMKGEIRVTSQPNQGTCFVIRLPLWDHNPTAPYESTKPSVSLTQAH